MSGVKHESHPHDDDDDDYKVNRTQQEFSMWADATAKKDSFSFYIHVPRNTHKNTLALT